jgi:hypothetical protein
VLSHLPLTAQWMKLRVVLSVLVLSYFLPLTAQRLAQRSDDRHRQFEKAIQCMLKVGPIFRLCAYVFMYPVRHLRNSKILNFFAKREKQATYSLHVDYYLLKLAFFSSNILAIRASAIQ